MMAKRGCLQRKAQRPFSSSGMKEPFLHGKNLWTGVQLIPSAFITQSAGPVQVVPRQPQTSERAW